MKMELLLDSYLLEKWNDMCDMSVGSAKLKLKHIKVQFDIHYTICKMRIEKIKELKKIVLSNNKSLEEMLNSVGMKYLCRLNDESKKRIENSKPMQSTLKLNGFKIPEEYEDIFRKLYEHEIALKINVVG